MKPTLDSEGLVEQWKKVKAISTKLSDSKILEASILASYLVAIYHKGYEELIHSFASSTELGVRSATKAYLKIIENNLQRDLVLARDRFLSSRAAEELKAEVRGELDAISSHPIARYNHWVVEDVSELGKSGPNEPDFAKSIFGMHQFAKKD